MADNFSVVLKDGYTSYFSFVTAFEAEANIASTALIDRGFTGWVEKIVYNDGSKLIVAFNGGPTHFTVTNDAAGKAVVISSDVSVHLLVLSPGQDLPAIGSPIPYVVDLGAWSSWNGSLYAADFLSSWLAGNNIIRPSDNPVAIISADQTLKGYAGEDDLIGSAGADTIFAGGGRDIMSGGTSDLAATGNDTFVFAAGTVIAPNSQRSVTVVGTDAAFHKAQVAGEIDTIRADGDNDFSLASIFRINRIAFNGASALTFGAGNFSGTDHIAANATIVGDAGANAVTIYMAPSNGFNISGNLDLRGVTFSNWTSQDSLSILSTGYNFGEHIYAPDVSTHISGTARADVIYGGAGDDVILGINGDGQFGDAIYGGGGSDTILAGASDDLLFGGAGADVIYGGDGKDYLQGDAGASVLSGDGGNDTIYGGADADYCIGGEGNDVIVGLGGQDSLYGGAGNDYIVAGDGPGAVVDGGAGANTLWGASGNDYMVGGEGADLVVGGAGSDYEFGNAGNDTLYGGQGTDYLFTNAGNDFVWTDDAGGAASTDYIYVGGGTGVDTVADFTAGSGANHDVLVVSPASGLGSFAQLMAATTQVGVYTVITMSGGDQVYLYNVQPFQLTAADFLFF